MKVFISTIIALTVFITGPASSHVLPYEQDQLINANGEYVVQDLDQPATTYAVDINALRVLLYTRNNKATPYQLKYNDASNLKNSPFNPSLPTKFIVHGWQSSYEAAPPQGLKDDFLSAENVNVILLDWNEYASEYLGAVGSAKNVGKNFATFISFLIAQGGLKISNIHIIGHSLGAHISGFIGKNINNIAHITGLDPAGPMFYDSKAADRLSSTDAIWVDALHTSTSAGINKAITQADFFPHGGKDQPMCQSNPIAAAGCDHTAGYKYFGASVSQKNKYPAKKCSSEDAAKVIGNDNKCSNSNAYMGDAAAKATGIFYVPL